MEALLAATAAFLLTHFVTSTPLRPALVRAMGEWPYRGAYSLVAFATLGWMIWAYTGAPRDALWSGPRLVPFFLMPLAFILLACGYGRNPTMVGQDGLMKSEDPARGIIRITRHPIMWGIMLFGIAHVIATGSVRALVFFGGGFVLLAAFGTLLLDRRKRSNPDFERFAAVTSHVPFVAIAQGRNRLDLREIGWKRPLVGVVLFFAFLFLHPWLFGTAAAQTWPTRPVTFVVPYPPGGGTDVIARIYQEPLSKALGQPIVIDNRGGAGGSIGTAIAAKAEGGHTFLFTLSSHSINPAIYKNLPFDTERDFRAVSLVASLPQLFAVNPGTPYRTFQDLTTFMSRNPGKLNYASVGVGSPSHMAGELLKLKLGVNMVHVPYRGGGPAVAAALAGDVPLLIVSIPAAMGQVQAGRLRPVAVSTQKRTSILPDVPTVAEATGLRDFEVDSWYAVFAPAKTPDEAVARMNREIHAAVARPEVKAKLLEQGAEGVASTPETLAKTVTREIAEWRAVVKHANISVE